MIKLNPKLSLLPNPGGGLKAGKTKVGLTFIFHKTKHHFMTRFLKRALFVFICQGILYTGILAQQKQLTDTVAPQKPLTQLIYTPAPFHLTAASVGAVYSKDILKAPVTSAKSALTGRLAGLYATQGSGQPGADGSSVSLRGFDPVVIIDGVVANLSIFNLEDIESVTVQKDALSTAMLGVRGSNGALLPEPIE